MDWLWRLLGRGGDRKVQEEVDAEIRVHLQMRERELRRQGRSPEEARAEAERKFGDLSRARRRLYASARHGRRRRRFRQWLDSVRHDLRVAARRYRAEPGHAFFTVLVLALGIGLTTATYTLVESVLLRPLPYPEPDRIVSLQSVTEAGFAFPSTSATNWYDWRDDNRTLVATGFHGYPRRMTVRAGGDAFRVDGVSVGGRFFEVMRLPFLQGRGITEEEIEGREAVAVVSEGFWRNVLGKAAVPGVELIVDGRSVRVVGVLGKAAAYPEGTDVWMPAVYQRLGGAARNNVNWFAVGRLRDGVSLEEARADLGAIADRIRSEEPAGIYSWGVGVVPLRQELVEDSTETLWLLLGGAGTVLLIACANLAGLGLARSTTGQGEHAVRRALGASRGRIVQLQIVEQLVLGLAGGLVGLGFAHWLVRSFVSRLEASLPRAGAVSLDGSVVAFALSMTIAAAVLSTSLPALRASRVELATAAGRRRGTVGGGRVLPGATLVAAEVALAVVLLVGGGLLVRSYTTLLERDLGFDPEGVVTADVALTDPRFYGATDERVRYWSDLLEGLRSERGISAVGISSAPPAKPGANGFIEVEGQDSSDIGAHYYVVSEGIFRALDIPVLAGRALEPTDRADTGRVVVVSRTMAERHWPGQSPLGRRVRAVSMEGDRGPAPWLTVVGVVGDVRHWGFVDVPEPQMYVHYRQVPRRAGAMTVLAEAAHGDTGSVSATVREAIVAGSRGVAPDMSTLERGLGDLLTERRLVLSALNLFAALAVGLASIGLYGLLSFAVGRRRREIAVRAALGATRGGLLRLVLRGALEVEVVGLAVGLLAAWWAGRLMESMLVGVSARDPVTFVAVAALLLTVGLVAALLPARRAASQDAAAVLRSTQG